jgi:hypothetical protein
MYRVYLNIADTLEENVRTHIVDISPPPLTFLKQYLVGGKFICP